MTVRALVFPAFLGGAADYRTFDVPAGPRTVQQWHRHDDEQVVIVLRGEFALEWQAGASVDALLLRPGSEHRIAAGMVHRLASAGGLVEVYTARDAGGHLEDEWM